MSVISIACDRARLERGGNIVVDDLNLEIYEGETIGILGSSGSGKTTLLNAISGFIRPTRGSIMRRSARNGSLEAAEPTTEVGYVFQDFALFPGMTVQRNISFGLSQRRVPKQSIDDRVAKAARKFEVSHILDRDPSELSGGEKQRVAIARTFAPAPRYYLLDEPFSQLDLQLKLRIRRGIHELLRGAHSTTVLVSHDFSDCATLCDRIGVIDLGRLLQIGDPLSVYAHPASLAVARLTGSVIAFIGSNDGKGCLPSETDTAARNAMSFACRPENIRIGRAPPNSHLASTGLAQLIDVRYLGFTIEFHLRAPNGGLFVALAWANSHKIPSEIGSEVAYHIMEDDVFRFSDREGSST
jgi:ABC-type Fe3+/spermidine/putrescine transport system ATPase subunit